MSVLKVDVAEGVATLTMNRPERSNALNLELGLALLDAFEEAGEDPGVRCVVLTGAGKAFCAGDDIAALKAMLDGEPAGDAPAIKSTGDSIYLRVVQRMVECPKPVVAALNGATAGAGLEMACAADLRVMSDQARVGSCLIGIGQMGNAVMLPRVIGPARATELFLSGRLMNAEEALAAGLVHEVVADAEFPDRVAALGTELATKATAAFALFKSVRERGAGAPLESAIRLQEQAHRRNMTEVADASEGALAFLEKRSPDFTGR